MIGPYGAAALKNADLFKEINADTAWFHGFDEEAFNICARYGIQACVEFPTFRADYKKYPKLVPIGIDGKPIHYGTHLQGVCLSNKKFLRDIEKRLKAGLAAFKPAGIWLDYMTYGGWFEDPAPKLQDSCFCKNCIKHFNEATGVNESDPLRIVSEHKDLWISHKCERIASFTKTYSNIIRSVNPDIIIGMYMCPYTPDEYDGALRRIFAQDYELIAPYIDVFTPLIYCEKSGRGTDWGLKYLKASPGFVPPGKHVQLILDFMDFPESMECCLSSNVPSKGIQMFSGSEIFTDKAYMEAFARCAEVI